ncbi:MAG: hypothetical protein ACXWDN_21360, partial [Limisphaerales bacterium]
LRWNVSVERASAGLPTLCGNILGWITAQTPSGGRIGQNCERKSWVARGTANHAVQRTEASRFAQRQIKRHRRLASAAAELKRSMQRALKVICVGVGVPLLLLIGSIAADQIPQSRAKPPKTVTDVSSCLAWLQKPMGTYRITDGQMIYYRVTGPAGRYLASGPSAYTFDSHGKFIGWTADDGDFPTPGLNLSPDAKRVTISLDELRKSVQ